TALLSGLIERAEAKAEGDERAGTLSLQELLATLDERAFGLGILILALPCAVPFLYAIPQIVAFPMLALAGQLAMGREQPWLPDALAKRRVDVAGLGKVLERARPFLGLLERVSGPRLTPLSEGLGARIIGLLMVIPCASIMVPLPLTNSTPAIGVGIAAFGLLERDGLLIVLGLLLGLFWIFILVFFGAEAVSAFKQLLINQFSS
ncbi:MAG: exopolysaccharide biosynthesis protein, partial [Parvularculaceae bacterium]|nr:exopolysaccharide biosynthesis protein [Parvularculaceae bacterium]